MKLCGPPHGFPPIPKKWSNPTSSGPGFSSPDQSATRRPVIPRCHLPNAAVLYPCPLQSDARVSRSVSMCSGSPAERTVPSLTAVRQ
jgi:hypothetical protein